MRGWSLSIAFGLVIAGLAVLTVRADDAMDRNDAGSTEPAAVGRPDPLKLPGPISPFLTRYCVGCHGGKKPKADLNLTAFSDEAAVVRSRKLWGRVKEYVEAGDMPPEDKPQPSQEEIDRFTAWIDATLAKVDCNVASDPGRVTIRRLNRAEYNNTIRDLLGVDYHPADDFPSDDVGNGFDNIGDVLTLPPILLEKYLDAAEKIVEQAIVTSAGSKGVVKTWEATGLPGPVEGQVNSEQGRVICSEGSIVTRHDFPSDGQYIFRARAFGHQAGDEPARMAFLLDGKALKTADVEAVEKEPGVYEHRVEVAAGQHQFGVAFVNDYYNEKAPDPKDRDRNLVVDSLEVQGPILTSESPLPESHRRIIFKTPTRENRAEVAREVLERFATRAYRRPVQPGEVARLLKFVDLAEQNGDEFERGIQLAIQAVLVSPQFLFRVELNRRPPSNNGRGAQQKAGEAFPISEFELASRLSYFLWSSMPDDELFSIAKAGKLREGDNLEAQVVRMLRDPKARALVENFADQWLQIRNLKTVNPDRDQFPTFDEALRSAMIQETELFFEAVVREDRSVLDLLDADFTFLNERLARHYGIDGVKGDAFRRVSLEGGQRGGILTQASILTVTSNPTRTSPVKRGKWILEQILGAPPPPPPGDVPELDAQATLTGILRQKMEQHRANPSCASCHARMDPLGFGFENFDAIGAWRDRDGGSPVDASGELPSGQTFRGPGELKAILKARDREFLRCLSEKMLTFALGRGVEYFDACALDKIVEGTAGDRYRFSRLVLEIVKSDPFQKRKGRG
jgi:hypothetical protein